MTTPELTDWHARDHDQTREALESIRKELERMNSTLIEIKVERRLQKVAGSYAIPGAVSLAVAYAVKKLGLL